MSLHEKRIVAVIDDDPSMRASLIRLLATLGCDTENFDSAESFLEAAQRSKAACLMIDIQLGDISGIELARQLATEGFNYPIIFMTGLNDKQVRRQAEATGCIAFLNKPFAATQLIEAVNQATGWSIGCRQSELGP